MSQIKRIYRRIETTETTTLRSSRSDKAEGFIAGDRFTVEVYYEDIMGPIRVYSREHRGSLEVEELIDGEFRLTGHK